jgi:hypothetical protein
VVDVRTHSFERKEEAERGSIGDYSTAPDTFWLDVDILLTAGTQQLDWGTLEGGWHCSN